jgi:hypothetical protein
MLNFLGCVLASRLKKNKEKRKKRIPLNLGSQLVTLLGAHVGAFIINILMLMF